MKRSCCGEWATRTATRYVAGMDCHTARHQHHVRSDGVALHASPIVRLVREAHFCQPA